MKIRGRTKAKGVEYYGRLNKDAVRSARNLPRYIAGGPRGASIDSIPSRGVVSAVCRRESSDKGATPQEAGRDTIIERVRLGRIKGPEADEIIRKSKCLAPAYNKGAYQYVGDTSAAEDAGRKK